MTKQLEKSYQVKPDYILRKVAGSNVLISVGENIANFNGYVQLNETATYVWKLLSEPKTIAELTTALCEEFDVSAEEAQKDASDFINELLQENMVTADG